ncbi:MAG: hypothetical protein ACKO83_08520 [Roseiflexaceae bacterium]
MNAPVGRRQAVWLVALICAFLIARLCVLLFAARPDNVGVSTLLSVTDVLVWPLAWIDATQPAFGARFERGTLCLIIVGMIALNRLAKSLR